MTTFTIDSDNNIGAHTDSQAIPNGALAFASDKDFSGISKDWPLGRLLEIWNSFAGVTPFADLKPAKQFSSRKSAAGRIWTAIQRLSPDPVTVPTGKSERNHERKTPSQKKPDRKRMQL